ncbi:hypothetical protein COU78_04565 [Candidatus Peregrinibacteria bacterium CG10_big_fil_rev_8_21_14_0_10_49_24]|nr:MAG: hypothetical protein COV83_06940 [Candidatus Peregrinibacteria bacterium CG11_big_fil_rev_8_21_14_0_20_49_14]PIR50804.1 MAG: hypothetical protein COU78_04565 [Candidatus Peregrinibacteria bacterium CG10_big_fil_rev_8_21_14_0_10_49_24]PJA67047.1 MAG: hypothetical protein CO157_06660 [Candidatus Peregrinibacteria bacterium CG_4_9_14_3_um_filter_49_12]
MRQSQFEKSIIDIIGSDKLKDYPSLQESLRKREKEKNPKDDDKKSDNKKDESKPDSTPTPTSPSRSRSLFQSPLDKTRDSGVISTGTTAAAVGASVYAGMNAAKFAGVPMLGKFAAGVGGALNGASTWVSSALTQVGAPSQLSVLANPWLIGMGAPLVGLWALGKYRMRTLKSYYQNHPSSPDAQATLEQIKQLENSTVLPRTFNTMKEGTKLVFGAMRWPIRAIPNALGSITGGGAAMVQNFSKKLGGLKGVLNWPFNNAGSLAKGGLAGGAAGLVTYGAMSAAAGVSAPLIAPFLIGAGTAIWAYRRFKNGKSGSNANLAMAG